MNGEPHTHELKVQSHDLGYSWGEWQVVYGDTTVKLADRNNDPYDWPTDELTKQVAKKAKEAIERHDRGTVIALQRQHEHDHKINAVRDVLVGIRAKLTDPARWGGEQLR
jgi:hypothetical protein